MNPTRQLVDHAEEWRKLAGLSVADFAKRLGIHESLWYKIRAGSRDPSIAIIVRLSKISKTLYRMAENVAPQYVENPPEPTQDDQGARRSLFQVVRFWR